MYHAIDITINNIPINLYLLFAKTNVKIPEPININGLYTWMKSCKKGYSPKTLIGIFTEKRKINSIRGITATITSK